MAEMTGSPESAPVGIAGASGFVGTFLRNELSKEYSFRALTRSPTVAESRNRDSGTEWVTCDLYSPPRVAKALEGCRTAIYLVHSMSPSSRLTQANFADLDLLLADNFIRGAEAAGVEHVLYLGGLMPSDGEPASPHLASRREVESVLRSRSVAVTVLRAGLIFGPGGSSFTMLVQLVRRLPVMILPAWVSSRTHSIDVRDVGRAFAEVLADHSLRGKTYDLGGHEPMTYRELIVKTGELLGRRPRCLPCPINAFTLSRHWVAWFGGVPLSLVGPLQESLRHDLQAEDNPLLERLRPNLISLESSLAWATGDAHRPSPNPRASTQTKDRAAIRRAGLVRSVQRMPLPEGWSADEVARYYGEWLTRRFRGLLQVEHDADGSIRFRWTWPRRTLLHLTPTPYTRESKRRKAFYIADGILTRNPDPPGRFEFRTFPELGLLIASIHGYQPRLPWWIYRETQAVVHLRVMRAFGRALQRIRHDSETKAKASDDGAAQGQ